MILRVMFVIAISLSVSAPSFAETSAAGCHGNRVTNGAGMKAERGMKNILFGWTDIPLSIAEVTCDTNNPLWGLAAGTFKGIGKAFPRMISGISDVVTFPITNCDERPVKPNELNTKIR